MKECQMNESSPKFIRKFVRKYDCDGLLIEREKNGRVNVIIITYDADLSGVQHIPDGAFKQLTGWATRNLGPYYRYGEIQDELIENNPLMEKK
jgi:hypothetical protein